MKVGARLAPAIVRRAEAFLGRAEVRLGAGYHQSGKPDD